jgi:hypothetical protein
MNWKGSGMKRPSPDKGYCARICLERVGDTTKALGQASRNMRGDSSPGQIDKVAAQLTYVTTTLCPDGN